MNPSRFFPCLKYSAQLLAAVSLLAGGCALHAPPREVSAATQSQWFAPPPPVDAPGALPHNGRLTDLTQWWVQQGDPLLVELIASAQAVSPSVASARSRIEQARATRVAAGAALGPALDASASISRSRSPPLAPGASALTTTALAGL